MGVGGDLPAGSPLVREAFALEIGNRISEISAHVHAAMAEIVQHASEFDDLDGWLGLGYRTLAHCLTVNCGFDVWMGREIFRVGFALRELPLIKSAFDEGRLSFDKVRSVTRVATADEDEMWRDLALDASGNQLARICRAVGRATEVDAAGNAEEQHIRRRLRTQWMDNGMLHVVALLPPEDGKLLLQAIGAAMAKPDASTSLVPDHSLEGWAARSVDALTLVVSRGLGAMQNESEVVSAKHQVVVHVDFDLLTGLSETGRCFLDDGPPIALNTLKRIGCSASVIAMIEKDGKVIDVRPERRFPTIRQRRILVHRDKTCLFPGCGMPAVFCEPHHINEWAFSHSTLVDEMGSLCLYHHQRAHEGVIVMIQVEPGRFRFETRNGTPLPPVPVAVNPLTGGSAHLEHRAEERGLEIDWETPIAGDRGAPFDLGLAVEVAVNNPLIRELQRGSPVV